VEEINNQSQQEKVRVRTKNAANEDFRTVGLIIGLIETRL
jgi:hypothetical protein